MRALPHGCVGGLDRLDVDDDVRFRQRRLHRALDRVGRRVALGDSRVVRDRDHDVCEHAPGCLAHPQPPQLHRGLQADDRPARRLLGVGRRAIHEDVHVAPHQPGGGEQDEDSDEEGRDGVGTRIAAAYEQQADEHGDRAREVAAEVERVRRERRARVGARRAPGGGRPGDVDTDDDAHDEQRVPRGVHPRAAVHQAHEGVPDDEDAGDDEDRALGKCGEMLGLAVAILVPGIGRTHGHADGEERQQRRDEIRARVGRRRDEPEAVGRQAGAELERNERDRCEHRPERGFSLGLHGRKRKEAQVRTRWAPAAR